MRKRNPERGLEQEGGSFSGLQAPEGLSFAPGRPFPGDHMRSLAAPCLLLLLACDVGPDEKPTAVSRAALSAPTRVITLDGGGSLPRNLIPQTIHPVDAGALIIADEPWFSDGSGQPATFLGDFMPGPQATSVFSLSRGVALFNGQLYFGARHDNQHSLWTTDGTFAGTQPAIPSNVRVTAINGVAPFGLTLRVGTAAQESFATYRGPTQEPEAFFELPSSSQPPRAEFVSTTHGTLFLYTTNTRLELLRTDGTDAGTSSLTAGRFTFRDLRGPLVAYDGSAWFRALNDLQLFSSDGADAGPQFSRLSLRNVTALDTTAQSLVVVGEESGSNGPSLLFTDGTDAGTRTVMGDSNGAFATQPVLEGTSDSHGFFQARLTSGAYALWAGDGTDAGTVQLTTFPLPTTPANNRLATRTHFFFTDQQGHPWASDGTIAGTAQLSMAVGARNFGVLDDTRVVFFAGLPSSGVEPWVSDGTAAGTSELADLSPGAGSSVNLFNVSPVSAGGRAWFPCQTPAHGIQTCVTDGTPAGTRVATPTLGPVTQPSVFWLGRANDRLLIGSAPGPVLGSDGTQAGTEALPFSTSGTPPVVDPGGGAWVVTPQPQATAAIWHTDGTRSGSVRITGDAGLDFNPTLYAAADRLFMTGSSTDAGDFIKSWRADAGFSDVPDLTPDPGAMTLIRDPHVIGSELHFLGFIPDAGISIIATDGTAAGTRVLVDASPLVEPSSMGLVYFGGQFFFRALSAQNRLSFARFDPSSDAGVELILPNLDATFRARLVVARNNLLVFSGPSLYRLDPGSLTAELLVNLGTHLLGEVKLWGDGLVFVVQESISGQHSVWATDGTAAGTRRITGTFETRSNEVPSLFSAYGDEGGDFFVSTWTRETGLEPGALGVNATSVTPLADLAPGPLSSNPATPVRIGDSLYFAADDGLGVGVFKLDATVITPTGGGGGSAGGGTGTGGGAAAGGGTAAGGGAGAGTGAGTGGEGGGGDGTAQPGCGCTAIEPSGLLLALLALRWRARRGSKDPSRTAPSRTDTRG